MNTGIEAVPSTAEQRILEGLNEAQARPSPTKRGRC